MNRLILIGNGFDLAHGLKTSYSNFIDSYWKTFSVNLDEYVGNIYEDENIKIDNVPGTNYKSKKFDFERLNVFIKEQNCEIVFKNIFLKHISEKKSIINWVDIEQEYYYFLKMLLRPPTNRFFKDVEILNKCLQNINNELTKYLSRIEKEFDAATWSAMKKNKIWEAIHSEFNFEEFSESSFNLYSESLLDYLVKFDHNNKLSPEAKYVRDLLSKHENPLSYLKEYLLNKNRDANIDINPKSTLLLNFNYTSTERYYLSEKKCYSRTIKPEIIHIHGELNNPSNPIIFGYGDELDEAYKEIENLNDNGYLENVKSIKYLETSNYKKLLQYINSDLFQVFIFGHSCGNSDRTLLNTIFEHDNCASIKVFYHQIDENTDNYSEVVRNISRNFNDKVKMRDRVVNKELCEPLVSIEVQK